MTLAKRQGTAFRGGMALILTGVSALAALAVVLSFLWPPAERATPRVSLGLLGDLTPGSVRSVEGIEDGPFRTVHLVRPASGPPHSLAGRPAPPRGQGQQFGPYGCSVPWRPTLEYRGQTGWFRDPCHGQTFDLAGNCQSLSCTRALDRVRLDVRADGEMILYPDQILKAPERGWPPEGAARP